MAHQAKDEAREERIHMEIIVDAYGPEEQARGLALLGEPGLRVVSLIGRKESSQSHRYSFLLPFP